MKVTMLMAQTVDGKIARNASHFPDWTGKEDKRLFMRMSKAAGVVIMGRKTYATINRPLPGRLNVIMTRNEDLVSENENLLYTSQRPDEILATLAERGHQEVVLAGGAAINTLFARQNLIDEIAVTISPLIFGSGLSLFSESLDTMTLQLKETELIAPDILFMRYQVMPPSDSE